MFRKISRPQLLAVTGWSTTDLDNRAHTNQFSLAHGLVLPTEAGSYIGLDCFALKLSDALTEVGFPRALSAQFVREHSEKWMGGLEQIEWPQLRPPVVAMEWAPTTQAIDAGVTALPADADVYFAVAKNPDGAFCGTMLEIFGKLAELIRTAPAPATVQQVNLRRVYDLTLAAAARAGVDLGAPFTRPVGHSEYLDWYAAVAAHRALSIQRGKSRRAPGPRAKRKAKAKTGKTKGQQRRASKSAMLTAE